ncbi:MAG: hypothetical protein E6Q97_29165 [Desulfurellales bacterium]|nr:MAG: hypothetical protein E6Q97_29165 [Desulfurellales bacterium]
MAASSAHADTMSTMTTDTGLASVTYDAAKWRNRSRMSTYEGRLVLDELEKAKLINADVRNILFLCPNGGPDDADACISAAVITRNGDYGAALQVGLQELHGKMVPHASGMDAVRYVVDGPRTEIGVILGDQTGYVNVHVSGSPKLMRELGDEVETLLRGVRYNKP